MAGVDNLTPFDSERASAAGKVGGANKKGKKHINTWVQEVLEDEKFEAWITDPKEGVKLFRGVPIKALVKAQVIKAVNGDTLAYKALVDSGWVKQVHQENSGEQKLIIETRRIGQEKAIQEIIDVDPDD